MNFPIWTICETIARKKKINGETLYAYPPADPVYWLAVGAFL
jgi:hypothetical protein